LSLLVEIINDIETGVKATQSIFIAFLVGDVQVNNLLYIHISLYGVCVCVCVCVMVVHFIS